MKFADFVILTVVFIALIAAIWYNHKDKKNGGCCCGDCLNCGKNCSNITNKKRGSNNEN